MKGTHREEDSVNVEDNVMYGLLGLANGPHHQATYLVAPPLKPHHEEAWDG